MKTVVLKEASTQTPLEKMRDANSGKRKQNWKACSDNKLRLYYKICIDNHLTHALLSCEIEIYNRGHHQWLRPRLGALTSGYSIGFAQHIWDERKTCHRIIQEAIDEPSVHPSNRPSEYLLRAYLLLKCMEHDTELKMMEIWIKNHMKDQNTYFDEIPTTLNDICRDSSIMDAIANTVSRVNYN
jgi:hypothetical protein